MNKNIVSFAQKMVYDNPQSIPNTPWAQAGINAILNGDSKAGEQLANNILSSMGMTKEQALDLARKQNLPF